MPRLQILSISENIVMTSDINTQGFFVLDIFHSFPKIHVTAAVYHVGLFLESNTLQTAAVITDLCMSTGQVHKGGGGDKANESFLYYIWSLRFDQTVKHFCPTTSDHFICVYPSFSSLWSQAEPKLLNCTEQMDFFYFSKKSIIFIRCCFLTDCPSSHSVGDVINNQCHPFSVFNWIPNKGCWEMSKSIFNMKIPSRCLKMTLLWTIICFWLVFSTKQFEYLKNS